MKRTEFAERAGRRNMDGLVDAGAEVLEVSLRAFWCKARGGGGRLRHATER